MKEANLFLRVARDELDTLIRYQEMLMESEDERSAQPILDEIMGDEFNHALISLLTAASLLNITIPKDGLLEANKGENIPLPQEEKQEGQK